MADSALLQVRERFEGEAEPQATLTLPFEQRQKSRLRARLDDGREVALLLARGTVLRQGDRLRADDGLVIAVRATPEPVSTALSQDPQTLARTCYHLGNRHVPLQIGNGWLRYLRDPVLDDMVRALGLDLVSEMAPFEPESGAYHAPHFHAAHDRSHD